MQFNTKNAYSTYMAKSSGGIDAETRALIDRAISEGKVTKVPMGVQGASHEYRWDGHKLAVVAGPSFKQGANLLFKAGSKKNLAILKANCDRLKAGAKERQRQIEDCLRMGMTRAEVIALRVAMGEGPSNVDKLCGQILKRIAAEKSPTE